MEFRKNPLREKLARGETAIGAACLLGTSIVNAMALKAAGFDWMFIELEHFAISVESAAALAIAADKVGITPIVRVPAGEYTLAARLLDNGAWGVIMPHIGTEEDAREAVRQFKFPPAGRRSVGAPLPQLDFVSADLMAMARHMDREQLIVAMIESAAAIPNIEAIAAVPGIDVLLVGQGDLSVELGVPGQLYHPEVLAVTRRVADACRAHGKWSGALATAINSEVKMFVDIGVQLFLAGTDMFFMLPGARQHIDGFRSLRSR
jgi:2-keto-3-deoxy-L-rhamnonate aldolase RhmA